MFLKSNFTCTTFRKFLTCALYEKRTEGQRVGGGCVSASSLGRGKAQERGGARRVRRAGEFTGSSLTSMNPDFFIPFRRGTTGVPTYWGWTMDGLTRRIENTFFATYTRTRMAGLSVLTLFEVALRFFGTTVLSHRNNKYSGHPYSRG